MVCRKNPLTMKGTIDRCWLFVYQTPIDCATQVLPPAVSPVTYGPFAFWNVVVCHLRAMRPLLVPEMLGVSYWHVAYRLYARFQPRDRDPIEGLYFVRSDCDNMIMSLVGNMLTDFSFHTAGITVAHSNNTTQLAIDSPGGNATVLIQRSAPPELPQHSPFASIEQAAEFLKYKPNGISITSNGDANIVHIARDEPLWRGNLVQAECNWEFFRDKDVKPEICYEVEPIEYRWNRGVIYRSAEN